MTLIFRQLLDLSTSTFTYLLVDEETRKGVLIDSVFEQHARDLALVRELEVDLVATMETHVHADHVTGAWLMKEAVGSEIVASEFGRAEGVDRYLKDGEIYRVGALEFEARATPGHTSGCMSFYCAQAGMVFTGDALLIRGAGRTDFQQGSAVTLYRSVREKLFSLEDSVMVYPAHDYSGRTSTTVAEEKRHNPRLGERVQESDFVGYMEHLGLPHPKQLDIAVPANLKCGKPENEVEKQPNWAPVVRTYAGVLQVEPDWVREHLHEVVIVDVRELDEINASPLGRIAGSRSVPLSGLREAASDLPLEEALIVACPSGARSAMASTIIENAGARRVANLRGGLLEWRALGFPLKQPGAAS